MVHDRVLEHVLEWAALSSNIRVVVLTGSMARGPEHVHPLSDIDIELYVSDPTALLNDVAVVPLGAVGLMLGGYRESAQIDEDTNLSARIIERHLQLGLLTLPRGPFPDRSWAQRPLSMLLDTHAFFRGRPTVVWRQFVPSS